jgi:hypothetical protein
MIVPLSNDHELRPLQAQLKQLLTKPPAWRVTLGPDHAYTVPALGHVRSVTQILAAGAPGHDGIQFARQEDMERGDRVHAAVAYLETRRSRGISARRAAEAVHLEPDEFGFLEAWLQVREALGIVPLAVEVPVVGYVEDVCPCGGSPAYPCDHEPRRIYFAGRTDMIAAVTKPPEWMPQYPIAVFDWKTGGPVPLTAGPQIAGYLTAAACMTGLSLGPIGGYGVRLAVDGTFEPSRRRKSNDPDGPETTAKLGNIRPATAEDAVVFTDALMRTWRDYRDQGLDFYGRETTNQRAARWNLGASYAAQEVA